MKAAVWYGREDIRILEVPEPQVGKDQVKIKVRCCGICGSDVHEYRQGPLLIPKKPHPLTGRKAPVILGHEFSGDVVEVGEEVKRARLGDRVTINCLIYCGSCVYCRGGEFNMCLKLGTVGLAWDGAFAETVVVPEYTVLRIPDAITYEAASFAEPLAVAVRAVKRSRLKIGDSAVVIGAGPIGLLVLQVARAAGASHVFVIEPLKKRRELAKHLGADEVFDPAHGDAGKEIADRTGGLRANIAFECVGNQAAFDTAIGVTGRRAMIVMVGMALKPLEVPFFRLWGHEKEITTCTGYVDEYPAALAFLADRRIVVEPMITAKIHLEDFIEKGLQEMIRNPEGHIMILVAPGGWNAGHGRPGPHRSA
jgi:(R,R)-butanediol dehydrogenase/meso-butanediol dehydrogenase/diacetyl reductase